MNYLQTMFYFINVAIHSTVYVILIFIPFHSKLRYSPVKTTLLSVVWIVFTAICDILFFEIVAPFAAWKCPMTVIWILISAAFMRLAIKGNSLRLFFVLFVLFTFQNNIIYAARLIYGLNLFSPILPQFEVLNYLLYSVVVLFTAIPFLWYLFAKMFKQLVDTNIDFLRWKYLFALPFLYYLYCTVSDFGGINLAQPTLNDIIQLLLLNSFAYFSYLSVLKMMLTSYENSRISEEVNLVEKQLEMQKGQYENLTEYIERTARLRHDWRHHLLLIQNHVKMRDLDGLEEYLQKCFQGGIEEEEVPVCQNHTVDIILSHYISIAKADGVAVTLSVDIPRELPLPDYQLSIIFGNLVENAVEGCTKKKEGECFIDIKAKYMGEQLVIIIQNSYYGEILTCRKGFLSTKHEGCGMGISSVRNIVERAGGNLKISYQDHVFKVALLIIL